MIVDIFICRICAASKSHQNFPRARSEVPLIAMSATHSPISIRRADFLRMTLETRGVALPAQAVYAGPPIDRDQNESCRKNTRASSARAARLTAPAKVPSDASAGREGRVGIHAKQVIGGRRFREMRFKGR